MKLLQNLINLLNIPLGGTYPDDTLVESVEIPKNDFFVGVQYHTEFKSKPNRANPIIKGFIKITVKK